MEVKEKGIYKHFKDHLVEVLYIAKHTETDEKMVVYKHLDTNEIWVRPYDMFTSKVDKEKYPDIGQIYRFELVEENN